MTQISEQDFDKCIPESIEEALSCLGEMPKQAVIFYLEKHLDIKFQDIAKNIPVLHETLTKIFGSSAVDLEALILRKLCRKMELPSEEFSAVKTDFVKSVSSLKQKMERKM